MATAASLAVVGPTSSAPSSPFSPPPLAHTVAENSRLMRDIRGELSEVHMLAALAERRRAYEEHSSRLAIRVRDADAPMADDLAASGVEPVAALAALMVRRYAGGSAHGVDGCSFRGNQGLQMTHFSHPSSLCRHRRRLHCPAAPLPTFNWRARPDPAPRMSARSCARSLHASALALRRLRPRPVLVLPRRRGSGVATQAWAPLRSPTALPTPQPPTALAWPAALPAAAPAAWATRRRGWARQSLPTTTPQRTRRSPPRGGATHSRSCTGDR